MIKELLSKGCKITHNGGWQLANDLVLPCLNVDRDEEIAENSRIFATFQRDVDVNVSFTALIYVRGKILIALASVDGQQVEEKVPVVILAKNEWFKKHQAASLAQKACLKPGVFKTLYDKIRAGTDIPPAGTLVSGEVTLGAGRDAKPVTAHMFALPKGEPLTGRTFI